MSLESWKKKFMPEPAWPNCSFNDAIYHAIRKWTGFRKENIQKHNVDPSELPDGDRECCFCLMFGGTCSGCPLQKVRDGGCSGPYREWIIKRNPEPMIDLLYTGLFWLYSEGKINDHTN